MEQRDNELTRTAMFWDKCADENDMTVVGGFVIPLIAY